MNFRKNGRNLWLFYPLVNRQFCCLSFVCYSCLWCCCCGCCSNMNFQVIFVCWKQSDDERRKIITTNESKQIIFFYKRASSSSFLSPSSSASAKQQQQQQHSLQTHSTAQLMPVSRFGRVSPGQRYGLQTKSGRERKISDLYAWVRWIVKQWSL